MKKTLLKTNKNIVKSFNDVISQNTIILLQKYYGITLNNIPLLCKDVYLEYGAFSAYDGENIIIDSRFLSLSELKKSFILAHEIAHFFQWKKLNAPKDRNVILNFFMEYDANLQAINFIKCIFLRTMPCKRRTFFWDQLEQVTKICQRIPKSSYQFSAFGVGGLFAVKQIVVDKVGSNKGKLVLYEGCHEALTRAALENVEMNLEASEKNTIVFGSTVNDMYFAFDLLFENKVGANVELELDKFENIIKVISDSEGAEYPKEGLSLIQLNDYNGNFDIHDKIDANGNIISIGTPIIESNNISSLVIKNNSMNKLTENGGRFLECVKFNTAPIIADLPKYLMTGLEIALTGLAAQDYVRKLKDIVNTIITDALYSDFFFIKQIQELFQDKVSSKVINYIADIGIPLGLQKRLKEFTRDDTEKNCENIWSNINCIEDWWKRSNPVLESFEKLIGIRPEGSEKSDFINLPSKIKTWLLKAYCNVQFLKYSHTKDLQFLHSMDCSYGNVQDDLDKCICFAEFCAKFYNDSDLKNKNFGQYVYELDDSNKLKKAFLPLIVPLSVAQSAEWQAVQDVHKEYPKYDKKKPDFFLFTLIESKKNEKIISAYKQGFKSEFAKWSVGEVFSMKSSHDPGLVALGMACHMIEDSFTASHTIRAYNIYNESLIDNKLDFVEAIPPIIYFADYTKQDSYRHMMADVFDINDNYGNITACSKCNAIIEKMNSENLFSFEDCVCIDPSSQQAHVSREMSSEEIKQIMDSVWMKNNHNIHSTMCTDLAKQCVIQYLSLVKQNKMENIKKLLKKIYACVPNATTSSEIEHLKMNIVKGGAGRSYEQTEYEIKDFFDKYKEKLNDFSLSNLFMSADLSSEDFSQRGSDFSLLSRFSQRLEIIIDEYRMYLIRFFSGSKAMPQKKYEEIKKEIEKDINELLASSKRKIEDINGEKIKDKIKTFKSVLDDTYCCCCSIGKIKGELTGSTSLSKRLLLMYDNFDIVYLSEIFHFNQLVRTEISYLREKLKDGQIINTLNQYEKKMDLVEKRYNAHLYEIWENLLWISGEINKKNGLDKKLKNDVVLLQTKIQNIIKYCGYSCNQTDEGIDARDEDIIDDIIKRLFCDNIEKEKIAYYTGKSSEYIGKVLENNMCEVILN